MIEWKKRLEQYKWLRPALVWGTVVLCTVIMLSLCFNDAVDYDEAYAVTTVRGNSLQGVWNRILGDYDTDIPLWYWMARIWTYIFGESIFSFKIFSLVGSVCTLVLGATAVFRKWGARAAVLFVIPISLAPAFLHYNISIRMYSWLFFFTLASALLAYALVEKPERNLWWVLLFVVTTMALTSHLMMAFHFLFIYGYLLLELVMHHRKQTWKVFVCGIVSLIPLCVWIVISGFLHFVDTSGESHPFGFYKVDWNDAMDFLFHTELYKGDTYLYALTLLAVAAVIMILMRKKFSGKGEWFFLFVCLISYFGSYFLAAVMSSVSTHFFTPRHIMMGGVLLWLGIAVVLSRANFGVWLSSLVVIVCIGISSYGIEYRWEYESAPYMEETKEMIEREMEAGDVVIYNTESMFTKVFQCYMPEQSFVGLAAVNDTWLQEHTGEELWFFRTNREEFPQEYIDRYDIQMENIGHYGFQLIEDYTDFDVYRITIGGLDK